MREDVLDLLQRSDKALSIYEIQDKLGINTVSDTKMLGDILRDLEEAVIIYHSNKDKYMLLENSHLRKGLMRVNKKGFGFVEVNAPLFATSMYLFAEMIFCPSSLMM